MGSQENSMFCCDSWLFGEEMLWTEFVCFQENAFYYLSAIITSGVFHKEPQSIDSKANEIEVSSALKGLELCHQLMQGETYKEFRREEDHETQPPVPVPFQFVVDVVAAMMKAKESVDEKIEQLDYLRGRRTRLEKHRLALSFLRRICDSVPAKGRNRDVFLQSYIGVAATKDATTILSHLWGLGINVFHGGLKLIQNKVQSKTPIIRQTSWTIIICIFIPSNHLARKINQIFYPFDIYVIPQLEYYAVHEEPLRRSLQPAPLNWPPSKEAVKIAQKLCESQLNITAANESSIKDQIIYGMNVFQYNVNRAYFKATIELYRLLPPKNPDSSRSLVTIQGWIPTRIKDKFQIMLLNKRKTLGLKPFFLNFQDPLNLKCGQLEPSLQDSQEHQKSPQPPTFFLGGKILSKFDKMVGSFSVPCYRGVNPTVVSTPFLLVMFGLMFPDVWHGGLLVVLGIVVVLFPRFHFISRRLKKLSEWGYIILLFGIQAIICGLLQNNIFSKAIVPISASVYSSNHSFSQMKHFDHSFSVTKSPTSLPLFVDSLWQLSSNKLAMHNSLQMKTSVIIGVLHMLFGILLNFAQPCDVSFMLFVLLPRVLIFMPLVYLSFMIILKWLLYSAYAPLPSSQPQCAPLLLPVFVGTMTRTPQPVLPVSCAPSMFPKEPQVELFICSLTAVATVFVLFGSFARSLFKRTQGVIHKLSSSHVMETIMQAIEFLLNMISHPVSYLRLWALALAHEQISEVTWRMLLGRGSFIGPLWGLVVRGYLMFLVTFLVLILMEGLTVLLHSLRLQWIEFGCKFTWSCGIPYTPIKLTHIPSLLDKHLRERNKNTATGTQPSVVVNSSAQENTYFSRDYFTSLMNLTEKMKANNFDVTSDSQQMSYINIPSRAFPPSQTTFFKQDM